MREQIFNAGSLSTTRKKNKSTIENSYGAIDISKENQDISIDFRRKGELDEPVHENSREKLEDGHKTASKMPSGEVTIDSKNKTESAVNYKENETSSNEKIMRSLHNLKDEIYNQTLFELLPESVAVSRKIKQEIKQIKQQKSEIIITSLNNIEQQIIDDGESDEEQDEQEKFDI